jgi:two-component system phosphate regulon response regulator PhoB
MLGGPLQEQKRILLVEDDASLSTPLCYSLETAGYAARNAETGTKALAIVAEFAPDLVLLDLMLPDISGLEVCHGIRGRTDIRQPAIIIVTAKSQEADRISGFKAGADDFVTKPFSLSELLLRIRARVLDRPATSASVSVPQAPATPAGDGRVVFGPLSIDKPSHRVFLSSDELTLSAQEMRLLLYLVSEPGRMRTRRELLSAVWGYNPDVTSRTLDTHIKRLRDKFGPLASMIQTAHGVGYRIAEPDRRTSHSTPSKNGRRRR